MIFLYRFLYQASCKKIKKNHGFFLQRGGKPPLKRAAMQLFFKKIYDFFMLWIFLIFFMLFLVGA
jgi:hypothetical protein